MTEHLENPTSNRNAFKKFGLSIRENFSDHTEILSGTVEVDKTFVGGLEMNKHKDKKLNAIRRGTGKAIVVCIKERDSTKIKAKVIQNTLKDTLHDFINDNVEPGSTVNTDAFKRYNDHDESNQEFVKHSVGEYLKEQAHIDGTEFFWLMLKRAYKGTFHKISKKH